LSGDLGISPTAVPGTPSLAAPAIRDHLRTVPGHCVLDGAPATSPAIA
jgi:hypothetical protein